MKILITGGAGFIASHIVDKLIELNHSVIVVDNLSSGKKCHLSPRVKFYQADLLDESLHDIIQNESPEIVIHHAAQIDVQTSLRNPSFDATVNINGTIQLLEAIKTAGVRKMIYASSAAVYGTPLYLPVNENHPVQPLSFYGISKHTPEHYIQVYSTLYGLDYTILRYANVYGTRQDPQGEGGVVSIFIDKLLNGEQPIIYGDGEQTRDFIYVQDIVEANVAALSRGSRSIYNISCNQQTTVNELLLSMCRILNQPYAPEYKPAREGDIVNSCLDNTTAIKELNWLPKYSLQDGLRETCEYYYKLYQEA